MGRERELKSVEIRKRERGERERGGMCNRKKEEEREERKDRRKGNERMSIVSYKVHPNPPTCSSIYI